jgi:FlgD Ig-like domain
MRSVESAVVAFALLAIMPAASLAAWPNQPTLNLPVSRATGYQQGAQVVSDGAGGAIVTWQDGRGSTFHIYAHHVLATGTVDPAWPVDGLSLNNSTGGQSSPTLVSDGAGGAIIVWADARSGSHPYAQHVLAGGVLDPAWPVAGLSLSAAGTNQLVPVTASDGAGGAIVAWEDQRSGNFDIYAQHALASGTKDPAWPTDGVALCTMTGGQTNPAIVADGAGGAIVAWADGRVAQIAIYAMRVLASGVVSPVWTANGIVVAAPAANTQNVRLVTDGFGGAIAAWEDFRSGATRDIYAQHIVSSASLGSADQYWPINGRGVCIATNDQGTIDLLADGNGGAFMAWSDLRGGSVNNIYAGHVLAGGANDPAWPANGVAVCTDPAGQGNASICPDGSGGAIVAWQDIRGGASATDVYAQHVLITGSVDATWPVNGRAVCTASGAQTFPKATSDGAGGAIVAWQDFRNSNDYDIFAQRVARWGYLGTPEAEMAGVHDVPNDNGGQVRVAWNASYLDAAFDPNLSAYDLYRSAPAALAQQARASGTLMALRPGDPAPLDRSRLVTFPSVSASYAWQFVQTVAANHFAPTYGIVTPTTGDSMGIGNPKSAFLVVARNATNTILWPSRPDSGYSVDNIPPVVPAPFTGNRAAGITHLHWNPNPDADLAGYRLYRGSTPSFTPGPATLLAALPDTGYADASSPTFTYKLTAIDVHGNESAIATLTPSGIAAVDGPPVSGALALLAPEPNPASRATTLGWTLPQTAAVRLEVFDTGGRRVRTLADGEWPAGAYATAWNLRDDAGRPLAAGLYFARLSTGGGTLVRRIAIAR